MKRSVEFIANNNFLFVWLATFIVITDLSYEFLIGLTYDTFWIDLCVWVISVYRLRLSGN